MPIARCASNGGVIQAAQHVHLIVQPGQWREARGHVIVSAGAVRNPITLRNPVAVEPKYKTFFDWRGFWSNRLGGVRGAGRVKHRNQRREPDQYLRVRQRQTFQQGPAR